MMINAHVGCFFATIINYPLSGFIAKSFGWETIFYASGGKPKLFEFIYFFLVVIQNSPKCVRIFGINYVTRNGKGR